ncbi:MAG: succinylglutamate desuccinylase/aspartoacylase family protein [Burkholderiaceae bacterium]
MPESVTKRIAQPVQGHHTVEVQPLDIERYRHGNTGVDFVHVIDSGRTGPTVMLQALTHGNEFCGAYALDYLLRENIRPAAGKLIVAFANVDAYARFDFDDPDRSRYIDEDYNRVWADEVLFGARDSAELRRARKLQPFVDAADFLLDVHSMHEPCRPIMVCGIVDKHAAFARKVGVPADLLLDTGHPAGVRMRDRGSFNDPASPRTALLIECGQHWEKSAVEVAIDTLLRFVAATGSVSADWIAPRFRVKPPALQRTIRVTEAVVAQSMDFEFVVPLEGLAIVPKAGTPIARDGDTVWSAPYDNTVLVMPSLRHLRPGNTQVRLGRYQD